MVAESVANVADDSEQLHAAESVALVSMRKRGGGEILSFVPRKRLSYGLPRVGE